MHVSHETIYQTLFVQGRGELRRELTRCLRTGR
jgi:IS30 family transposase